MAPYSKIDQFDPTAEEWSSYEEWLQFYFIVNDTDTAEKQRAVLLTVCGPETYTLACNLVAPEKPSAEMFDELVKLLTDHYSPKLSIIIQLYKFHSRSRRAGESVAVFVAGLRRITKFCEFMDLDNMLRDRLV